MQLHNQFCMARMSGWRKRIDYPTATAVSEFLSVLWLINYRMSKQVNDDSSSMCSIWLRRVFLDKCQEAKCWEKSWKCPRSQHAAPICLADWKHSALWTQPIPNLLTEILLSCSTMSYPGQLFSFHSIYGRLDNFVSYVSCNEKTLPRLSLSTASLLCFRHRCTQACLSFHARRHRSQDNLSGRPRWLFGRSASRSKGRWPCCCAETWMPDNGRLQEKRGRKRGWNENDTYKKKDSFLKEKPATFAKDCG